jgi:hypothetical protein
VKGSEIGKRLQDPHNSGGEEKLGKVGLHELSLLIAADFDSRMLGEE